MSDLPKQLREILPDLEHGKGTHEIWANCDQKYRDENPDIGDVNFHLANVKIYEQRIHLVTSAADLIESQQQRIAELTREVGNYKGSFEVLNGRCSRQTEEIKELAAHVERLRGGLNDAIEALVAETSESGSVEDAEIHDLRTLELSTPTTSLNALRREAYFRGYYQGAIDYADPELNGNSLVHEANEEARKRYPDKE